MQDICKYTSIAVIHPCAYLKTIIYIDLLAYWQTADVCLEVSQFIVKCLQAEVWHPLSMWNTFFEDKLQLLPFIICPKRIHFLRAIRKEGVNAKRYCPFFHLQTSVIKVLFLKLKLSNLNLVR